MGNCPRCGIHGPGVMICRRCRGFLSARFAVKKGRQSRLPGMHRAVTLRRPGAIALCRMRVATILVGVLLCAETAGRTSQALYSAVAGPAT